MIFLLGGYDLEMVTIKALLELHKVSYIDEKLSWGAKLSDYKKELNRETQIYGIELEEDIKPPKNYISIDHHNENSHKISSLEQVSNLLNIELNRHQILVAKNDSAYIKGMKSICATNEEIKSIRDEDRKIQGVTEEDEVLASKSIHLNNNSNIIYSLTSKFSAISDRVYDKFDNYIIYNDFTVSFYGYNISKIIKFLNRYKLGESDYYYGGGDFGFIGLKDSLLSKEKIKSLLKEFKEMSQENKIISHHTFMFPFIIKDDKSRDSIIEGWEFQPYKDNYNERAYFHSFFQKSMFTDKEVSNSAFYTKKEYKDSEFIICKSKEYKLNLKSVNLRILTTGVGILSFHIENKKYSKMKEILEINDYGRRIYPEYLDEKDECTLVPNYIKIIKDKKIIVTENFQYEKRPVESKLSQIITHFFPIEKLKDKIEPAVDDRMFVISFYKNSDFSNELKYDYIKNDKWYEYLYIDGNGKTVQNSEMQEVLIKKATYQRWQGYGTLYGVSKYSFVANSDESDFVEKTVEVHMQTIYFQMFSLLLMLRATILKFSSEVSDIADEIDNPKTAEEVGDLYKRYIQFVNSFYFREITAKDQGLEIYEKAIGILNIERDIKDLDSEIEELHRYVEMKQKKEAEKEAEKTNKKLNDITFFGGVLLFASFLTSFFGMNIFDSHNLNTTYVIIFIILAGTGSLVWIKKGK